MAVSFLGQFTLKSAAIGRYAWLAFRIFFVVALVVVPFGYAITDLHTDVLMGAGCGIAIGVGVGVRGGSRSGPWTGILVGSIVGVVAALLAGLIPGNPFARLIPPLLALAVGLIDGLRGSDLLGYRDMGRESFVVAALLILGLLPAWIVQGYFSTTYSATGITLIIGVLLMSTGTALAAGLLSHRRVGWRDNRPPLLLFFSAGTIAFVIFAGMFSGEFTDAYGLSNVERAVWSSIYVFEVALVTVIAFLVGRWSMLWLEPRLRIYGYLADYLTVMWPPIGAFAVGYLTIILLFSGFYGMLDRFQDGAFEYAGSGIADWILFSFYTSLGQEFGSAVPVSVAARILVGTHLILSAAWAVVLFAAVMSSIGPRLDQVARRHEETRDD
ncbi:MAG: hypothetical protein OXG25_05775 [Gammaproteobacteria bacterium]|nr:hypothetical protein [Gammaproteobacteria bacterium]